MRPARWQRGEEQGIPARQSQVSRKVNSSPLCPSVISFPFPWDEASIPDFHLEREVGSERGGEGETRRNTPGNVREEYAGGIRRKSEQEYVGEVRREVCGSAQEDVLLRVTSRKNTQKYSGLSLRQTPRSRRTNDQNETFSLLTMDSH